MADNDNDELLRAVKRVRKALLQQRREATKTGKVRDDATSRWFEGYADGLGHAADMLKNAMQEAKR